MEVKDQYLMKNGEVFFYLADTCWSAFTNIELDEWESYCQFRQKQGYNAIQINVLRQWDASHISIRRDPFEVTLLDDGHYIYDYQNIHEDYFDRAEKMLEIMRKYHLTPALVLLWANYVPDTWTNPMITNNLFNKAYLINYVKYVVKRFQKYEPIYFVSGDTDFPTLQAIEYYQIVLDTLKTYDKESLVSFHIKGRLDEIPEQFLKRIDFFSYQSGHNKNYQNTAFTIPQKLRQKGIKMPIINTEPCYEQISYSHSCHEFGRFSREDIRKIAWQSILSGANAGITYGAHGIWSWHHKGENFGVHTGEGFDVPFDVITALTFQGAYDYAFLKQLVLKYQIYLSHPVNIELMHTPLIRISQKDNDYFIYLPCNTELDVSCLNLNLSQYTITAIDLEKQTSETLKHHNQVIEMHSGQKDALYILSLKR